MTTRLATDHDARSWQAKVIVVEDDLGILRTVADNLRFEQYEVFTATDGETAYALHQKEQPDLIVLPEFCDQNESWTIEK